MQFANPAEHMATQDQLASIKRGELWRIVTPVFLHSDPLLLFCNMLVWLSLASMMERSLGSSKLAILCLIIAIIANFAQALSPLTMGGGIQFGGLAPVVLGLFGYAWVKSRIDAAAGIVVSGGTILFVLIYLWICITSEHAANIGLTFGLFAGVSIALLASPTEQV